jgi:hypothetical protein
MSVGVKCRAFCLHTDADLLVLALLIKPSRLLPESICPGKLYPLFRLKPRFNTSKSLQISTILGPLNRCCESVNINSLIVKVLEDCTCILGADSIENCTFGAVGWKPVSKYSIAYPYMHVYLFIIRNRWMPQQDPTIINECTAGATPLGPACKITT